MRQLLVAFTFFFLTMKAISTENRLFASLHLESEPIATDVQPVDFVVLDAKLFSNWGDAWNGKIEHRKGFSLNYGLSYDPNDNNDFLLASFQWLFKYKDFWVHDCPDNLMFKLELAAGMRLRTEKRGIISCGMFAQRYLDFMANQTFRPYVDGGVGLIYTDFQNEDQGLRINFNPRFSLGTEIRTSADATWYAALRFYHISNADIHKDNRGINATMLLIGRYF